MVIERMNFLWKPLLVGGYSLNSMGSVLNTEYYNRNDIYAISRAIGVSSSIEIFDYYHNLLLVSLDFDQLLSAAASMHDFDFMK
jgi:hypothetical protein